MENEDFIQNGYKEIDDISLIETEIIFEKEFINCFEIIDYKIRVEKDTLGWYHAEGVFRLGKEYFTVSYIGNFEWTIKDMEKFMARVFNNMNCDAWGEK